VRTLSQDLREAAQGEAREGRQHLLDHLPGLVEWAEEVGGCQEYRNSLLALLRARDGLGEATLAAFLDEGTWPGQGTEPEWVASLRSLEAKVSDVTWTLRKDQATYEALLRLIFEDPMPIGADDMKRLKGAVWRR
jgi:hypothetical protein